MWIVPCALLQGTYPQQCSCPTKSSSSLRGRSDNCPKIQSISAHFQWNLRFCTLGSWPWNQIIRQPNTSANITSYLSRICLLSEFHVREESVMLMSTTKRPNILTVELSASLTATSAFHFSGEKKKKKKLNSLGKNWRTVLSGHSHWQLFFHLQILQETTVLGWSAFTETLDRNSRISVCIVKYTDRTCTSLVSKAINTSLSHQDWPLG